MILNRYINVFLVILCCVLTYVCARQQWFLTGQGINNVLTMTHYPTTLVDILNNNHNVAMINDTSLYFGNAVAIYEGYNLTIDDMNLLPFTTLHCETSLHHVIVKTYSLSVSTDYMNPTDLEIGLYDYGR
jgi:hypothetical protein